MYPHYLRCNGEYLPACRTPDVKHIRRYNPYLLELPGGLFATGNSFSSSTLSYKIVHRFPVELAFGLFPGQTSHPEQVVATPFMSLFGRAKGNFIWHADGFACICTISARGHVMSQSQSCQSRVVGGAIANTSFYAWVEDEPACRLTLHSL